MRRLNLVPLVLLILLVLISCESEPEPDPDPIPEIPELGHKEVTIRQLPGPYSNTVTAFAQDPDGYLFVANGVRFYRRSRDGKHKNIFLEIATFEGTLHLS